LEENNSDLKSQLLRRLRSLYSRIINKKEEKQAMIMHRIKQMHDKENSGVPMKTYTNQNIEEFRRTMHVETYFNHKKLTSNLGKLGLAPNSAQEREAAKENSGVAAHDLKNEEQVKPHQPEVKQDHAEVKKSPGFLPPIKVNRR